VVEVQSLEHDRRAPLELGGNTFDLRRPGERLWRPRDVFGVVAEGVLLALLHDAEGGVPQPAARDAPFDVLDREEVVEAPLLVARNEEGLLLPVLVEETLGLDGPDATR